MGNNEWEFRESDGYEITMTDNYFDYMENCTIDYDIDEPYLWTYSMTININFKFI